MKVFIDTSAFISLLVENEQYHGKVRDKFQVYKQKYVLFFTSDYILDELFTWLLNRGGKSFAERALKYIQKAGEKEELKILIIDKDCFEKAQAVFLKFSDHRISFTDATTYVFYKDFSFDEIFTLDSDFKKMGLNTSF